MVATQPLLLSEGIIQNVYLDEGTTISRFLISLPSTKQFYVQVNSQLADTNITVSLV